MSSIVSFREDLMKGENPELLKKVSTQNRKLKRRFDQEIIAKQNLQADLKETYKPITDTQQLSVDKQITKTDDLFQQLLADLQGKHDRSSRLLTDIIRGLARCKEETRKQGLDIVSSIAKQPLLVELINKLDSYPDLVKKIMHPDGFLNLDEQDRKTLEPLNHLNNNDLRTLVHYYVLQGKIKSPQHEEDVQLPTYTDSVYQEHSTDSPTYKNVMTNLKKRQAGLNNKGQYGIITVSPMFYYEANDPDTVKFGNYNVLFKDNKIKIADKEYILTQGLELLLNRVNPTLDERILDTDLNNYLTICIDAGLDYRQHQTIGKKLHSVLTKLNRLDELNKDAKVIGNGLNTIILPDNVTHLKERLNLLIGEYSAGNKSMFNEINAILDILFNKGIITKKQLRDIIRKIK